MSTKNPELVSIILSAAKVSQTGGKQTVLVCMSDGVEVFRKVRLSESDYESMLVEEACMCARENHGVYACFGEHK